MVLVETERKMLNDNSKTGHGYYPGDTLLFKNPGDCHERCGSRWEVLSNPTGDPRLRLYDAIDEGVKRIGHEELFEHHRFLALPKATFHGTALGGFSLGDLKSTDVVLRGEVRSQLEDFLYSLPSSLSSGFAHGKMLRTSPLVETTRRITFEFDKLSLWKGKVLVAKLKVPDDDVASRDEFAELCRDRETTFGLRRPLFVENKLPKLRTLEVHVSVGYFQVGGLGKAAKEYKLDGWDDVVRRSARGCRITFEGGCEYYGHVSMATYLRERRPGR